MDDHGTEAVAAKVPEVPPPAEHPLRALYAIEFLVAMMAIFGVWSEVGGPSHMDLIEWYWKLALGAGFAAVAVLATRAAVRGSVKTAAAWIVTALLLITAMGLLTYRAHLHEGQDEADPGMEADRAARRTSMKAI